jgi:hypothetical protein
MCALAFFISSASAQGFLEKKLAKLAEAANTSTYSKSDYEAAAKDSASAFLDGKEILKDSRSLSGIYYSTTPIYAMTEGDKPKTLKKFLVNYTETPDYNNKIDIYNQYSYETTNNAKYCKPASFVATISPPSKDIMSSNAVGSLFLGTSNYDASKYTFFTGSYKKDLQGNYIPDGTMKAKWNNGGIIEIEPGIILIGSTRVILDKDHKVIITELENYKKYNELTVLYKAGKEALAAKYTKEYMWDKLADFTVRNYEAGQKMGYTFRLSPPGHLGIIPEHQAMKDVAGKLYEEAAKAKGYPIKVLYVYSLQGPYYNVIKGIRPVGAMPMQVNIGRSVSFYVVFENLKPAKMDPNVWHAPNKYGFTTVTVGENMRDDLYNINEYSGKYYLPNFPAPFWLDASENAMMFKGK